MGLTYNGGFNLLDYVYNKNPSYGIEKNQEPASYDSWLVELTASDGTAYNSDTNSDDKRRLNRGSQDTGNEVWNVGDGYATNFVVNLIDIQFAANGGDAQTFTGFNLYIGQFGADVDLLFATGTLNTPITVQPGETPIIRAYDASSGDGLKIDIDETNLYTSDFRDKIYRYLFLAEDSFSGIAEYKFVIYNTSGNSTPLEFYLTRDSGLPNFNITSEAGGSYAAARNASDVVLPLNQGSNISTDEIRMFYSQGTFPNYTYLEAGDFIMREIGTGTPITYTIANGETARLKTNFLRINAR